jgi:DNA processing protein
VTPSDEGELATWIRLEQTAGVGPDTARKLLAAFGLPQDIFGASLAALGNVVSERVAKALKTPVQPAMQALIDRTIEWSAQRNNHVLTWADPDYPKALLNICDPPVILYVKGQLQLLTAASIAIVGSRNATAQGLLNAEQFAAALSHSGMTVISGLALGIDTSAHRGSLKAYTSRNVDDRAGLGSTIAVIGTGADIVYPARNRALAHEIAEFGCIVSEYPLGMPAIAANFPRRNRIISGLSSGVLVVEAAAQSGSLITARMAGEQGREVFAIPGSIHSPLSKGCHQLIRQGAKLVESAQDILEELPSSAFTVSSLPDQPRHPPSQDPVLIAMGFDPVDHDTLALRCNMDSATLSGCLLKLELSGSIAMLPGGAYQRLS